jgi:hypothetical protein
MTTENKSAITEAIAKASEQLIEALKQGKSEALTQYLEVMARFRSYSFHNVLLIATQRPDASRVAGFNTWKSLGRFVRKGEKGIRIIAPIISRKKEAKSADSLTVAGESHSPDRVLRGFRFVHVFAQEQTDGDELPSFRSSVVEGDVTVHYARLVKHVADLGITLEYADDMAAQGLSYGGRIVLKKNMPPAETFSVLVHETSHELMHKAERRKETTKTVRETEAEAVAYVVCSALGLATNGAAADYISLYSGDAELLMASLALIQQTASGILKAITDKTETEPSEAVHEPEFALPTAA